MDQLQKKSVLSQLHLKHWLLIRGKDSFSPIQTTNIKKDFKDLKYSEQHWLSLCKVPLPTKVFMLSFNICQSKKDLKSTSAFAKTPRYYLLYIYHIIYNKYLSELSSQNIKNGDFICKHKALTHHIYLFTTASRKLRDKYNND